jgi:polar amino acid transport system substrate-binding protein
MYELDEAKAEGLYPRLLEEIVRGIGFDAKILPTPWKRALLYGETGIGGVGGAYKNDERLKIYDYSAPLYQEKMVVFVNKDRPFEFNELEDLSGKVIGVNRGWSYGQKFDSAREAKLFEVNVRGNPGDNFKLLALGRIDCLILDQLSGESYVQYLGISDKIVALPVPFSMNNGYLMFSKELKMGEFLNRFNSSLENMRENGTYKAIVQKFVQGTFSNSSNEK